MTKTLNYKSANIIPQDWHFAKLDLFDNATVNESIVDKQKLKLSISFRHKQSNELISIRAGLNSPKRHYTRNISNAVLLNGKPHQHYKLCSNMYDEIVAELGTDCEHIRISKLYESRELYPGKYSPKTIENATAIVYKSDSTWYTMMILDYNVFQFCLNDSVTDKQRLHGVIATNMKRSDFVPKAMTPVTRITNV